MDRKDGVLPNDTSGEEKPLARFEEDNGCEDYTTHPKHIRPCAPSFARKLGFRSGVRDPGAADPWEIPKCELRGSLTAKQARQLMFGMKDPQHREGPS